MRIAIDSTFDAFLLELNERVSQIALDEKLAWGERAPAIRRQQKESYAVASKCFPQELKALFHQLGVGARLDAVLTATSAEAAPEGEARFNAYEKLRVIQFVDQGLVRHEKMAEPGLLAKALFGVGPQAKGYNMLLGLILSESIGGILQYAYFAVPAARLS
jgi:hypothetical protein